MRKFLVVLATIAIAIAVLAACKPGRSSGNKAVGDDVDLPLVPAGTERVSLVNGSYVIYRFDLPAGAKWSDYNKLTAEYMMDEENLKRPQRKSILGEDVRLMGNYEEDLFAEGGYVNINSYNGPYIIDSTPRNVVDMGMVANQWFTIEYDISGAAAHQQFDKDNLPAANATGPFFFGIGIPGKDGTMKRDAKTQLIRNVTLVHRSNPALNVVSKGSGLNEPAMISYSPEDVKREGPSNR